MRKQNAIQSVSEKHNAAQVQREIRIHSQLQHENIIALYGAFEDSEHVYLALEYASGAPFAPSSMFTLLDTSLTSWH